MYACYWSQPFKDSVEAFARNPQVKATLLDAVGRLVDDPFDDLALRTHRVKRAAGETFTSRVGGAGHRLIWRRLGDVIVLLLFGEHDAVYRRAERLRVEVDSGTGRPLVVDIDPTTDQPTPYRERRAVEGSLFMAWNDLELAEQGFEPHEIGVLRRLDEEAELADLSGRMDEASFERAYNLIAHGIATPAIAAIAAEEPGLYVVADPQPDQAADQDLGRLVRGPSAREEFAPLELDTLADVLSRPIEDWMIFLHPDQARLAQRPFSGPARIRGGAGTGKTVVALHRARHLAERHDGPILFTTFVRNLPPVFAQLFRRLAPQLTDRVEFVNLHKWAYGYLRQQGSAPPLDAQAVSSAFSSAWSVAAPAGSYLAERGYGRSYYREELDWVIKGRGLTSLEGYLALERAGRGTALGERHRREVWDLFEAYERNLEHRRLVDFNDVLLSALQRVRADGSAVYRSVIVDEAQDLTEVGVRLLHALVGNRPDGLLLVGDLGQSVYPGGYSLKDVGVDVVGRSGLLRVNYRSTRCIVDAAARLVAPPDEAAGGPVEPEPVECLRQGDPVRVQVFASTDDHDEALALAVADAAELPGADAGDLAVLVPTNRLAEEYERRIAGLGLRTQELQRYDGTHTPAVKVGTYQRAKGLEFKQVFLPRLESSSLGEQPRVGEDEEAYRERVALLRRQLFVAVTRARDHVWLGAVQAPGSVISALPAA